MLITYKINKIIGLKLNSELRFLALSTFSLPVFHMKKVGQDPLYSLMHWIPLLPLCLWQSLCQKAFLTPHETVTVLKHRSEVVRQFSLVRFKVGQVWEKLVDVLSHWDPKLLKPSGIFRSFHSFAVSRAAIANKSVSRRGV